MEQEVKFLIEHDHEYFERCNLVISRGFHRTNEQNLKQNLHILNKVQLNKDSVLEVLSIGSGDGQADSLFVDAALSMGNSLRYVAVEPSEKEVDKFKALVESKQMEGHWSNATFDFHPITVQQYLLDARKTEERQHFDIISCPESAYFFTDAGEVFAELYQLLNKGGILLNTMCGGAWEQLTIEVAKYFPSKTVALPGSSTLREILQKRLPEVDFQVVTREYSLDVGECFQEGSRVGNMLLDFFVQILDFRKDAPKEVVDKIMAFMDENCSRTADGKRNFVVCEEDIIISRKH